MLGQGGTTLAELMHQDMWGAMDSDFPCEVIQARPKIFHAPSQSAPLPLPAFSRDSNSYSRNCSCHRDSRCRHNLQHASECQPRSARSNIVGICRIRPPPRPRLITAGTRRAKILQHVHPGTLEPCITKKAKFDTCHTLDGAHVPRAYTRHTVGCAV
jgi:hypothetical protein